MSRKSTIYIGMLVGSTVGSFVPNLWGAGFLSFSSIFLSAVGGLIGIWLGYKLSIF